MITIRMRNGVGLHVVDVAVKKLLEAGCDMNDIMINRDKSNKQPEKWTTTMVVLGGSEAKIKQMMLMEEIVCLTDATSARVYRRGNGPFCRTFGDGFRPAREVVGWSPNGKS